MQKTNKRLSLLTTLTAACLAACLTTRAAEPFSLMVNEDNDHFFHFPSDRMTADGARSYLDSIIGGGRVSEMVFCCCGQPANWDSSAWEPVWQRLTDFPETYAANPKWRAWPENAKLLHDRGVDLYALWIARCREKGVGAWLSMRMNDVHFTTHRKMQCLRTVAFWRDHPELRRSPDVDPFAKGANIHYGWKMFALDYSKPAVYGYSLALARELLERFAPDGLELDWMRYVTHLTPGREREQGGILTRFMRDVRKIADAVGAARGRRIRLGARIPSNYAFARALGYDPETWAREGLCDLFVPCNKDSADFACNVADWKARLAPARVVPGMDRLDCAGGEKVYADLAGYRGWADAMRARGADGVYLFNAIYLPADVQAELWRRGLPPSETSSLPRRYVASYPDSAPDAIEESDLAQLPWRLAAPRPLDVPVGNVPADAEAEVTLAFDAEPPADVAVTVNGRRCGPGRKVEASAALYGPIGRVKAVRGYRVPKGTVFAPGSTARIEVAPMSGSTVQVIWSELTISHCGQGALALPISVILHWQGEGALPTVRFSPAEDTVFSAGRGRPAHVAAVAGRPPYQYRSRAGATTTEFSFPTQTTNPLRLGHSRENFLV